LFADVAQPMPAGTGVLARNETHIAADLLAAMQPFSSSDDQHESQRRDGSHARMSHQPQARLTELMIFRSLSTTDKAHSTTFSVSCTNKA
jgi:hypothetical protein